MASEPPKYLWKANHNGQKVLDGTFPPIHTVKIVLQMLEAEEGFPQSVAEQLRQTVFRAFAEPDRGIAAIDKVPSSDEEVESTVGNLSILLVDFQLAISMIGCNLGKWLELLPEERRQDVALEMSNVFTDEFQESGKMLQVQPFFENDFPGNMVKVFQSELQYLIPPNQMIHGTTEVWPFYFELSDAEESQSPIIPESLKSLAPLFSRRTKLSYRLLPPLGKLLSIKVATHMAGRQRSAMQKYLEKLYEKSPDEEEDPLMYSHQKRVLQSYETDYNINDGRESNAARVIRRISYLVQLQAAMLLAIQRTYAASTQMTDFKALPPAALANAVAYHQNNWVSYQSKGLEAAQMMMRHSIHPITGKWVLLPLNATLQSQSQSTTPKGESLAGITFLQNQLKIRDTVYRMPLLKSPQSYWIDWFARIRALPNMYESLKVEMLIPALITNIRTEDARIIGWQEKVLQAKSHNIDLGLSDFLTHVRKLVMPTGTARREAALELDSLTEKPYEVDDCQAMSAKVQKIFWNLFPNVTEETEPISRLTAMKHIHKMLEKLKNAKVTKSHNIVKAWKDYSAYLHTQMFVEYLDESLHITQNSSQELCTKYLEVITKHLEIAHKMYVQTHDTVSPNSQSLSQTNGSSQQSVNAFTGNKSHQSNNNGNKGHQSSTNGYKSQQGNGNNYQGAKRKSYGGAGNATKKRKHPKQATGGSAPGSTSGASGETVKLTPDQYMDKVKAGLRAVNDGTRDPKYKVGHLRKECSNGELSTMTLDQVAKVIQEDKCLVCRQPGHKGNKCVLFPHQSQVGKEAILKYKKLYYSAFYAAE